MSRDTVGSLTENKPLDAFFRWQISVWNGCSTFRHHGEGIMSFLIYAANVVSLLPFFILSETLFFFQSRFYLGDVGNGAAMKIVVNMIMGRFCRIHFSLKFLLSCACVVYDCENVSFYMFQQCVVWWHLFLKDCFSVRK